MVLNFGLENKVALVTAASKGIGYATAKALVANRARVVINARAGGGLDQAVEELNALNEGEAYAQPADLTKPEEVNQLMDAVLDQFGRLDVLVCITPGPKLIPFENSTLEDWDDVWRLVTLPVLGMLQRAVPVMKKNGAGSIILVTSTWVKQPLGHGVLSAALRSALSSVAKSLANELGEYNVRVNQVLPGPTLTDRLKHIVSVKAEQRGLTPDAYMEESTRQIALRRYGEPQELGDVIAFLASERASFVTGTAFQVDGGQIKTLF